MCRSPPPPLARCSASSSEARGADGERFKKVFHYAREHGVYFAPSPYEAGFVSAAHGDDEIDETLSVFDAALSASG
jgi:glutamate-1-semialdehyde 2,1-aminomutase